MSITELRMYSTASGKLPELVAKGEAECFVEYSQYMELLSAYEEITKECVTDARRYKWLTQHPTVSVSNFMGKYRVTDSEYVITEWFSSRDEAIDMAMELIK